MMPVYFAYGSNMDKAAMAGRCPRSTPRGVARLPRHRVDLTMRGFATVVRDPGQDAFGILWDLAFADVPALDRWEEVSRGMYAKLTMPVVRVGGAAIRALVYVADTDAPGAEAPPEYGLAIVDAARDAGLPPRHVDKLGALFGARHATRKRAGR